jgi:hypothetical protein
VWVGCHIDSSNAPGAGLRNCVLNESPTHPLSHPLRLDEEILKFDEIARECDRRKPDRFTGRDSCDPSPPFRYGNAGIFKKARMPEQCRAVASFDRDARR